MSEFSHLIPSNLKELEVRKPSVQGSAYAAAEGRINFHSASARAIDTEADTFDIKLREMAVSSLQNNYFGQSDLGKAVANAVASIGLAAQRSIGMSDDDFVAYYGGGNYEYLPNGESAYKNITDPSLSQNWTEEDQKELALIKKRYDTDEEYKELVDLISPEKRKERLNKLRQQRDISDQALAEHFSQADGFFETGSVFAQTVASYLVNDPVSAASIFLPAARFRQGTALATAGKFKLGFKQGGKDALPFAATFPAIGAVEEARLLDLGASAAEAQEAYFDRLLEVPAAFGVRALSSLAIDLTIPAGRVVLGSGGKVINRVRKPKEPPKTTEEPPTEGGGSGPTETTLSPEEIAKRQAAEAQRKADEDNAAADKTNEELKDEFNVNDRLKNKQPFTDEEQTSIVENINNDIPLVEDRISKADLFDENGVAKIDNITKAVGGEGDEIGISAAFPTFYDGIYRGRDDNIISDGFTGGEFAKLIRGVDAKEARRIVKGKRILPGVIEKLEQLQQTLKNGGEVTKLELGEVLDELRKVANKKLKDKLNSGGYLIDAMPEYIAAAKLIRAKNGGKAPKNAESEADLFPFDLDETQLKTKLEAHVEIRVQKAYDDRKGREQTDEEKVSVSELDKQLKVIDDSLNIDRRNVEKDFSKNLNALNAKYQKKYDAIDDTEVDKRLAVRKEWKEAANTLRKAADDTLRTTAAKYEGKINEIEAGKAALGDTKLSLWHRLRRIREQEVDTPVIPQRRENRKKFVARTGTPLKIDETKPEDVRVQQSEKAGNEIDETSAAGNEKRADSEIDKKFANGNVEDVETIQRQGLYKSVGEGATKKRVLVADVKTKVERLNVGTDAFPRYVIRIVFSDNHGGTSKTNIEMKGDNQVSIENDTVIIRRAVVDKFDPDTSAKKGTEKPAHAGKPALRIDTINVEPGGEITFQQRYYLDEAAVREIDSLQGISNQDTAANVSHEYHRPSLRALSENWAIDDTTAFEGGNELKAVRRNNDLIHKCQTKGR